MGRSGSDQSFMTGIFRLEPWVTVPDQPQVRNWNRILMARWEAGRASLSLSLACSQPRSGEKSEGHILVSECPELLAGAQSCWGLKPTSQLPYIGILVGIGSVGPEGIHPASVFIQGQGAPWGHSLL